MIALYSHTTRATGTTLTAAIYNTDHQNHINNGIPAQLDDYSQNLAEMQTITDPGEVGTESLATNLAGEIERLRFAILEAKQALDSSIAQWYQTPLSIAAVDASGRAALPPWYIKGLNIRIAVSSPAMIEVATGWCRSADDTENLKVTTPKVRGVLALWASQVATGAPGMGVTFGAVKAQSNVFVFKTQASGYDVGLDTSNVAANLLTRASAPGPYRRIGVIFAATALGTARPMYSIDGEHVFTGSQWAFTADSNKIAVVPTTVAPVQLALVPTGYPVVAHMCFSLPPGANAGDASFLLVFDGGPNFAAEWGTVSSGAKDFMVFVSGTANTQGAYYKDLRTSVCGDIYAMAGVGAGANASGYSFRSNGFRDYRMGPTGG